MPLKVLIIEPSAIRHRQLRSILASLGTKAVDINVAEDHRNGMDILRKKRFDCCFLAMDLPGKNCVEFVEEIRASILTRSLPVIVIGAGATKESVLAIVRAGASGFLAVPLTLEGVEQCLRQTIGC